MKLVLEILIKFIFEMKLYKEMNIKMIIKMNKMMIIMNRMVIIVKIKNRSR